MKYRKTKNGENEMCNLSLLRSTPMKMERIEISETSALKAQMPGDYTQYGIQHTAKVWNQD